jgi:hypothetical protein
MLLSYYDYFNKLGLRTTLKEEGKIAMHRTQHCLIRDHFPR